MFSAKGALGFIAELGVGAVVGNTINENTPEDLRVGDKLLVTIGTFVIGGVVGAVAKKYVNETYDQIEAIIKESEPIEDEEEDN